MDNIRNNQGMALMNQGHSIRQIQTQIITPISANIPSPSKRRKHKPQLLYQPPPPIKEKPLTTSKKELDGFILLEATKMGFPEDGKRATIAEKGFNAVVSDDLNFFTGLVYLDASDNLFDFHSFQELPQLCDLRLCCNYIENIFSIDGYLELQYLDLSYNRLSQESVISLAALPKLRDLDLTGNELKKLPENMQAFRTLEKLILEHNKIDDNSVFFELCQIPNLREVGLAYNLLSYVPAQSCGAGYFRVLEVLDVTYNFVATQSALEPCLECPRLMKLLIYGNPILGATGEDPTGVYVEELIDGALQARDGYSLRPLDIVTEAPVKRSLRKGGFIAGRHSMYKEFSIEEVDNERDTLKKTARQYKMEGNKTLFAQAVDTARNSLQPLNSHTSPDFDDGSSVHAFFLTSLTSEVAGGKARADQRADEVMRDVAKGMKLNSSEELQQLKDKMGARYKEQHEAEKVPYNLFSHSMTEANTLKSYPIALNTAIKSLRFAIQYPLTNHDEVPSSSLFPPKHHRQVTLLSDGRQKPRMEAGGQLIDIPDLEERVRQARDKNKKGRSTVNSKKSGQKVEGGRTSKGAESPNKKKKEEKSFFDSVNEGRKIKGEDKRAQNSEALKSTMEKIDDVLDGLNKNTLELSLRHNGNAYESAFKGVGRPNTGVRGLIDMVNNVVSELAK